MEKIIAFVSFLIALSIASERLVEIIKNLIPPLNTAQDDPTKEGLRRAALQFMAVLAGVFIPSCSLLTINDPIEAGSRGDQFSIVFQGD